MEGFLAELASGGVPHRALSEVVAYSDTRVDASTLDETSFVGVDNLVANKGGRVDASFPPNTTRLSAYAPGDILLGNIRPYLKKVWRADSCGGCSGDVLAMRINSEAQNDLDSAFLYYLLSSDAFFAYDMQHAKGAKMPRGSKQAIMRYRIPVPPLNVQREIVRILDSFTELEAELEAALEAELESRRRQYAHHAQELLVASQPDGSNWRTLDDFAEFKYGFTATAQESGDLRFLRITDISPEGKLLDGGAKYVPASGVVRPFTAQRGDLLMARTGGTFGKTMLFDADEPAAFASFLIRIRFPGGQLMPAYYWHFAQSSLFWSQANALVTAGGQPQFNANSLRQVRVPVPALEEQKRVVGILDALDALVNDLSIRLHSELAARRKQYEYYRDKLLTFPEAS